MLYLIVYPLYLYYKGFKKNTIGIIWYSNSNLVKPRFLSPYYFRQKSISGYYFITFIIIFLDISYI